MPRDSIRHAFSITDLMGVLALIVIVGGIAVPALDRTRELSKRSVCAINLKGLGFAGSVYADEHHGQWMIPPYKMKRWQDRNVFYLCTGSSSIPDFLGCVGFDRHRPSTSETLNSPTGGSTTVTTTRAYWMLVRSGAVPVKQFVCPSNQDDVRDPTTQIDLYYDFEHYRNVSYGYLVPFGPTDTTPRLGADNRIAFAADKGLFYTPRYFSFQTGGPQGQPLQESDSPKYWRGFNSPNHGGIGNGEGQNVLKADGHVTFQRKAACGVEGDNIYTAMTPEWNQFPYNLIHGAPPDDGPNYSPYPGQKAFNYQGTTHSTTDSLIYP